MALSAFADSIAAIIAGLRGGPPSHARVNGAASGIDHLGRRLHGLVCVRDREIAHFVTAAVGERKSRERGQRQRGYTRRD